MLSTQPVSHEAGRQRQGRLWSNLKEVCELLHLPPISLNTEELLFQHVQFKTGQRVHTIGTSRETLGPEGAHLVFKGRKRRRVPDAPLRVSPRVLTEFAKQRASRSA